MKFAVNLVAALPVPHQGVSAVTSQDNAPWGLGRLSSVERLTDQDPVKLTYRYLFSSTGRGVDIYVVGSGVAITHSQFNGRARWGATFGKGLPNYDDNGIGTHCAGVAAGSLHGVAKEANIIAVKVTNSKGQGSYPDIVSAIEYVSTQAIHSRQPSVLVLDFTLDQNTAVQQAIRRAINRGVHVILGAGNDNTDIALNNPIVGTGAVIVAASNIADNKASISNYGSGVSIIAPGEKIISTWNEADYASKILTSSASSACHVAGLVAYLFQRTALFHQKQ